MIAIKGCILFNTKFRLIFNFISNIRNVLEIINKNHVLGQIHKDLLQKLFNPIPT